MAKKDISKQRSKQYIYNWAQNTNFISDIEGILNLGTKVKLSSESQPSKDNIKESQLPTFVRDVMEEEDIYQLLREWWLCKNGSTPVWDMLIKCKIDGDDGIVMIEAKANKKEFDKKGKNPSESTIFGPINHAKISNAIEESCLAIRSISNAKELSIGIDNCYQLSNRIAWAWKLSELNMPVVLLFLGFIGDKKDAEFKDEKDWSDEICEYFKLVKAEKLLNSNIYCGSKAFKVVARSVKVDERMKE